MNRWLCLLFRSSASLLTVASTRRSGETAWGVDPGGHTFVRARLHCMGTIYGHHSSHSRPTRNRLRQSVQIRRVSHCTAIHSDSIFTSLHLTWRVIIFALFNLKRNSFNIQVFNVESANHRVDKTSILEIFRHRIIKYSLQYVLNRSI